MRRIPLSAAGERRAVEQADEKIAHCQRHGARHWGDRQYSPEQDRAQQIAGNRAEIGVCEMYDLPWLPQLGRTDVIDCGNIIEVRARIVPGRGTDLGWHPPNANHVGDNPSVPWLLVHAHDGGAGALWAIGWLWGYEAAARARLVSPIWGVHYIAPPYHDIAALDGLVATLREAERDPAPPAPR